MTSALFYFVLITGSVAALALLLTRGRPAGVRLSVVLGLQLMAVPLGVSYGAYSVDWQIYTGRRTHCLSNIKNLEVALEMYKVDHQSLPSTLSHLTPNYLKTLPSPPNHQLVGAYDADSRYPEKANYGYQDGQVDCPRNHDPATFFRWLKER